ncbi:MAG TPA: DNA ligase D [Thermoanaerobaculia bacterium]|jgi:bifunctional non-homologous end joining protein LigD|nr:DNA ligase D [Thermoanaerobaculia bacterium]
MKPEKSDPPKSSAAGSHGLAKYRAKRDAAHTPEPMGLDGAERPRLFVVQQHAARALHWDLRMEIGGALKSWAVPKGPSDDPHEKRMAVHVEDHPLEYADFEGIIPKGNYGAGQMIVWDRGRYVPLEDMEEGLQTGKLLFELKGYKLRGRWTLVKLKKDPTGWLLIKERDPWANASGEEGFSPRSILSGLTVEDLRDGDPRAEEIRTELVRLKAPEKHLAARDVKLMLAETREEPFTRAGWLFELKYDGYRLLAEKNDGEARLLYRSGRDATRTFPEIARAIMALPYSSFVLDGEVVVVDESGHPSFQRLQNRGQIGGALEAERAAVENPSTLFAFDLLAFEDFDLRTLPLVERKRLLERMLPQAGVIRYTDHVETRGVDLHGAVAALGLEGIMAKRSAGPYRNGRHADWLKIRVDQTGDFAIVGWKESESRGRPGFAGLHLAVREGNGWSYAGSVGSGFTEKQLNEIRKILEPFRRDKPLVTGALPKSGRHVWLEPRLAVEVRFKEWTNDGHLRHPVFLRLRDDKPVEECVRQGASTPPGNNEDGESDGAEPPAPLPPTASKRKLVFTSREKVFWPEEGYTKGDLIDFYQAIAPAILPYLAERPLVLDRYPDGIEGKSFYQKDASRFLPEWIRTVAIRSESGEQGPREINYILCDDADTLAFLANLGVIPLHVWASRADALDRPDWTILDLDPKGAPFANVIEIARFLGDFCRDIGWTPFLKTSGGSGLHILLPLGRQCAFEQARQLAEVIARHAAHALPKIATIERNLAARRGRVYIDFLQNGRGKLIAAPFSARPRPGATVSTPLRWEELKSTLHPSKFTIRSVPRRVRSLGDDPLAGVLTMKPDLAAILEALHARV